MKPIVYQCTWCDTTTSFTEICTHELPDEGPPEQYVLAQCDDCRKPSLFYREDMGDGFDGDSFYRLWPPHDRHLGFFLPKIVRDSYEEAVLCERSKSWIATVVMVGRALEAVCKEFEPSTKTMFKGLEALHSSGKISDELLEWAHYLRTTRNLGAHATEAEITQEAAAEALDFLQAILEILYELRPKFEKIKGKNKKRGPTRSAPR